LFDSAKALTEGFFHLLVLGLAVFLAVNGSASFGDILAFSALFLSVMTPIAEVHRILDEGHEAANSRRRPLGNAPATYRSFV
jgi:ATP-binding cassette, subfamily B, bacterial